MLPNLFSSTKTSTKQFTNVSTGPVSQSVNVGDAPIYQTPVAGFNMGSLAIPGNNPSEISGVGVDSVGWSVEGSNWIPLGIALLVVVGAVVMLKVG